MSKEKTDIILTLVISTLLLLTISVFFVVMIYRYHRKIREKERQLFHDMLKAQEEDRRRVARDIHDSVGGLLGGTRMLLADVRDEVADNSDMAAVLEQANDLLGMAITEARNASHALMPEAIKKFGLKGAINDLEKKYGQFVPVKLDNDWKAELGEYAQLHLFRIISELFHNTLKYAEASEIKLSLRMEGPQLVIRYSDNGKGFDFRHISETGTGNGLNNIMTRVKLLNGQMDFKNQNGSFFVFWFNTRALPL